MFVACIGSGDVHTYFKEYARSQDIKVINISSQRSADYHISRNLDYLDTIKLPNKTTSCVIFWCFRYISNMNCLNNYLNSLKKLEKFIEKNPFIHYIFISTALAPSPRLRSKSGYVLSKYLTELKLLSLCNDQNISLDIIRPALIYGHANCPIKKIALLRRFRFKLIIGSQNSIFAVTSIKDLNKAFLLSLKQHNSTVETKKLQRIIHLNEIHRINFEYIHAELDKYFGKPLISLELRNRIITSFLYRLITGKSVDFSLASANRYPERISTEEDTTNTNIDCFDNVYDYIGTL